MNTPNTEQKAGTPETDAIEKEVPESADLCEWWYKMDAHARALERELHKLETEQGRVHDVLLTIDEIPHYDDNGVRGIDEQVKDLAGLYRQLQKNCLQAFDLKIEAENELRALRTAIAEARGCV